MTATRTPSQRLTFILGAVLVLWLTIAALLGGDRSVSKEHITRFLWGYWLT